MKIFGIVRKAELDQTTIHSKPAVWKHDVTIINPHITRKERYFLFNVVMVLREQCISHLEHTL